MVIRHHPDQESFIALYTLCLPLQPASCARFRPTGQAISQLAAAGLMVVSARRIETGGETFYWVIARKPNPAEGES